jgi:hypothetical protein
MRFSAGYSLDAVVENWALVEAGGRQSFIVKGMVSGGKYWFRVRALNAHGESPWSQPVVKA